MKKSTTFQNLVNSAQQSHDGDKAKAGGGAGACRVCQCHSPTTEAYLEESRLNGLPVIPFAFPTSVVAERMRQRKERHAGDCDKSPTAAENKTLPQDIFRRNVSLASVEQLYPGEFDFGGPRSLENLVYIAQRELISESLQPHEVMLPGAGASASSMETAGTAYSAASDDGVDDEIASLGSHHRGSNRGGGDSDDPGLVMVAPADDPNKTPVVRPARQDSGGYFEMAPPSLPGKLSSFSPPKDRFPSPSPPPKITAQRHGAAAAPIPQRASSARKASEGDFFEMDFSGRS